MKKTVFKCENIAEVFAFYKDHFPRRKKPLSLRQFASLLGYKSPRTVGMIIRGQRFASKTVVSRLIEVARLEMSEKSFCEYLWELEELQRNDPGSSRIAKLRQELKLLRQQGFTWRNLDDDKFKVILEWHFAVLLAGLDSPHFPQDPEEISALLDHRVSPLSVRESLDLLRSLNIIVMDSTTKRWKTTGEGFVTSFDVPAKALRRSHQNIFREATKAVEKFSVHEREFIHVAFPAAEENMPVIKERIRQFVMKMAQEFWDPQSQWIHRLGVYLYPETRPENLNALAEKKKPR